MAQQRLSLAQQIAQLSEATPVDFDPEDLHARNADPEEESADLDLAAGREHYLDVGPSSLRKAQQSIADPKYSGARTSRAQLMAAHSAGEDSSEGEDDPDSRAPASSGDDGASAAATDDELPTRSAIRSRIGPQDEDDDEEEDEEDQQQYLQAPSGRESASALGEPVHAQEDAVATSLRQKRAEDVRKGAAVSRQLAIFDTLLDARIRLQKAVTASNALPKTNLPDSDAAQRVCAEALALSAELTDLHDTLLTSSGVTLTPPPKRRRLSPDASRDARLRAATQDALAFEHAYHPHLVHTLGKWSAKVQAAAPPAAHTRFAQHQKPKGVLALVDEALAKTQTEKRHDNGDGGERTGGGWYDDTAFYQQLLRDVIDARAEGAGAGDDGWMEAQRAQKARRKREKAVDTKASKGRKLRFDVHEKLQNFMVPAPPAGGGWHEAQIDELFASLLGRGVEHAPGAEKEKARLTGFRLFG